MTNPEQGEVAITCEGDIVQVRKVARAIATDLGLGLTDVTRVVTAASELARNIQRFAGHGVMRWRRVASGGLVGLELVFADQGPGIPDLAQAMAVGFTTGGGLGMGLPGCKRLMDDMDVQSVVGKGTTVTIRKWRRN